MDRNEAIKVIKDNWSESIPQLSEALQTLIPELQDCEDERIREECIAAVKTAYADGENRQKCIAWLEKQGVDISSFPEEQRKYMEKYLSFDKVTLIKLLAERDRNVEEITKSFEKQEEKSTDKVEPKFKVGDIITPKDRGHEPCK
jgi:hypothetical protein